MINIKYRIKKSIGIDFIKGLEDISYQNLKIEKKYLVNDSICIYKIEDFLIKENKGFFVNFYYEKTKFYDFKQTFLSKLIIKDDQVIYIMENVGYVFITDLLIKSFKYFWEDVYSRIFNSDSFEVLYQNF